MNCLVFDIETVPDTALGRRLLGIDVELSDEDLALKENLELCVTRSADPKAGVAKLAMETMRREIKSATR